jgi:hypothetical protein
MMIAAPRGISGAMIFNLIWILMSEGMSVIIVRQPVTLNSGMQIMTVEGMCVIQLQVVGGVLNHNASKCVCYNKEVEK